MNACRALLTLAVPIEFRLPVCNDGDVFWLVCPDPGNTGKTAAQGLGAQIEEERADVSLLTWFRNRRRIAKDYWMASYGYHPGLGMVGSLYR